MNKSRRSLIAGNWKMNCTTNEAKDLATSLKELLSGVSNVDLVICPPFTALAAVSPIIKGSNIKLGSQDIHWEPKGAYTGETSPTMLLDFSCEYAIIGHSERRHIMGETNDMVNKKVKSALAHNITPILCVGELLEERSMGATKDVVKRQLEKGIAGLSADEIKKMVIAYEPVWAIGTGKNATPKQANDVQFFIRNLLIKAAGEDIASKVRILYGGSVKPENAKDLLAQPEIDGALVGGASLDAKVFTAIVNTATVVV
ncbi:MAG: triose-phosphate isomerase [Planctomycetes bacterium RBG_16_43_13]|nr:MAG: triose-phosphate isomerase [Planctomycetes bacterium RBG_16_43_13]